MGYNRSGVRRTKRLKRAHKQEVRLAAKAQAESGAPAESTGVMGQVKKAAASVANAVGTAVHAVAETLTGKKDEKQTKAGG